MSFLDWCLDMKRDLSVEYFGWNVHRNIIIKLEWNFITILKWNNNSYIFQEDLNKTFKNNSTHFSLPLNHAIR
jgi:hypothetical protein